jgi:transketolase
VTGPERPESLWATYGMTLVELGESDPKVVAVSFERTGSPVEEQFRERFRERFVSAPPESPAGILEAAKPAHDGSTVFARGSAAFVAGSAYRAIRDTVCADGASVKFVADAGGSEPENSSATPPFLEDLGIMRGLPGMTVIVPADAPSTGRALHALHGQPGPAYLRLSHCALPTVTDGTFEIGRAAELRAGGDLTIVALGALVARALEVARLLAEVGISVRVLDFASVKPFDEPALLRAARDTGAILVLEEHTVLTGVGALVASTTAENYPVPVRRVGIPDLFMGSGVAATELDRYGLDVARIRDEAWELLRLRGKVT